MASLDPGESMVFDALYGLEFGETSPERMTATCPVTPKVLQPFGIVHGGVFCAIGDVRAEILEMHGHLVAEFGGSRILRDRGAIGDREQQRIAHAPEEDRSAPAQFDSRLIHADGKGHRRQVGREIDD